MAELVALQGRSLQPSVNKAIRFRPVSICVPSF